VPILRAFTLQKILALYEAGIFIIGTISSLRIISK
jgi:hypothetical protein